MIVKLSRLPRSVTWPAATLAWSLYGLARIAAKRRQKRLTRRPFRR